MQNASAPPVMDSQKTIERLPALLAELTGIIGLEAVLILAAAKGGLRVYIPPVAAPDHWLTQLIGAEAAQAVCDHFRQSVAQRDEQKIGWVGRPIDIPSAKSLRREMLFELSFREGLSIRKTAVRLGVSERAVSFRRAARRRAAEQEVAIDDASIDNLKQKQTQPCKPLTLSPCPH